MVFKIANWDFLDAYQNRSPEEVYFDNVKSALVSIFMEEEHVSEKAFGAMDELVERAKQMITENGVQEGLKTNVRPALIAELIYFEQTKPEQFIATGKEPCLECQKNK